MTTTICPLRDLVPSGRALTTGPGPTLAPDAHELGGRVVLVTGATGFIGRHLSRRLVELGVLVHATTRVAPAPRHLAGVHWHSCDVSDPDAVDSLIARIRPAAIFHLASRVEGHRDQALALPMLEVNARAAVAVMDAAQRLPGCRVLLAGSVEEPRAGEAPCSPYAAAKHAATGYAQLFHSQWGLPVTVLRIAMVYGPDQPDQTKVVPYTINRFLDGEVPALGRGARPIDWVYVDDVVDAFIRAGTSRSGPGLVVDIGSGVPHTVAEVVAALAELTGYTRPLRFGGLPDRRFDTPHIADPTLAAGALGWRSATPLRRGLAATVVWHRDHARTRVG